MKLIKKILSGAMALTMAASMMLSTAVQAGATTKSDGSHEYNVKWTEYYSASKYISSTYHRLSIGPFDSKEIKALKNEVSKYEYGKTDCLALMVYLFDNDSDTEYQFNFYIDKWSFEYGNIFAIAKNGKAATDKEYKDVLGSEFYEVDGKTYLNLDFQSDDGIAKQIADCEDAQWIFVKGDSEFKVSSTHSLGNNTYNSTLADFTVEKQEKKDGEFKVIKHIKAEDNVKEEGATKDISKLTIYKVKNMTYTGKNRKPAVTIKDGNKTLVKGTDYTVSYKNCKSIGTATVTIKGKGDYTGSKTIEYKIVPKKTTLKVSKKSDTKAKFTWTAVDGAEKYQIYYSTNNGKSYKKLATVSGKKTSYTSSKLDFEKYDYKFKIRSYGTSDGKKYYSSYSKVVTTK